VSRSYWLQSTHIREKKGSGDLGLRGRKSGFCSNRSMFSLKGLTREKSHVPKASRMEGGPSCLKPERYGETCSFFFVKTEKKREVMRSRAGGKKKGKVPPHGTRKERIRRLSGKRTWQEGGKAGVLRQKRRELRSRKGGRSRPNRHREAPP